MALADLNWTRTLNLRQAAALSFDDPSLLAEVGSIHHLNIHHAPESKLTALLLASWFASQLSWVVSHTNPSEPRFRAPSGAEIQCKLVQTASGGISAMSLHSEHSSFSLQRESGSSLLLSTIKSPAGTTHRNFPAGHNDVISLLTEEMMPGTRHRVYLKALGTLEALLF